MIGFAVWFLALFHITSYGSDCDLSPPFDAIGSRNVFIDVERISWNHELREETVEPVCATASPLVIGVYDIRGREADWYDCFHRTVRPTLECKAVFQGKPAKLIVRPGIAIRSRAAGGDVRDTHAHVFLLPEGEPDAYYDTFVRSLSSDLHPAVVQLDATSGGRGSKPAHETYSVRLRFR